MRKLLIKDREIRIYDNIVQTFTGRDIKIVQWKCTTVYG